MGCEGRRVGEGALIGVAVHNHVNGTENRKRS